MSLPKRWRHAAPPDEKGKLGHLRGEVDGMPVLRWWAPGRQTWEYEVIKPSAIRVGLWLPEGWCVRQGRALVREMRRGPVTP